MKKLNKINVDKITYQDKVDKFAFISEGIDPDLRKRKVYADDLNEIKNVVNNNVNNTQVLSENVDFVYDEVIETAVQVVKKLDRENHKLLQQAIDNSNNPIGEVEDLGVYDEMLLLSKEPVNSVITNESGKKRAVININQDLGSISTGLVKQTSSESDIVNAIGRVWGYGVENDIKGLNQKIEDGIRESEDYTDENFGDWNKIGDFYEGLGGNPIYKKDKKYDTITYFNQIGKYSYDNVDKRLRGEEIKDANEGGVLISTNNWIKRINIRLTNSNGSWFNIGDYTLDTFSSGETINIYFLATQGIGDLASPCLCQLLLSKIENKTIIFKYLTLWKLNDLNNGIEAKNYKIQIIGFH